jgi:hypothetical protein
MKKVELCDYHRRVLSLNSNLEAYGYQQLHSLRMESALGVEHLLGLSRYLNFLANRRQWIIFSTTIIYKKIL